MPYDVSNRLWDVQDVEYLRSRVFGMLNAWEVGFSGCEMFEMWDFPDVGCGGCGGCGMFGMWNVRDVRCLRCGMFGMWDVRWGNGCGIFPI